MAKKPRGGSRKREPKDLATSDQTGRPVKPRWLDAQAKWFWDQVVVELIEIGVVGKRDGPALAMLATWYSRWVSLARDTDAAITDLQRASKEFGDLSKRFGLTPADRASLNFTPAERPTRSRKDDAPVDPLEQLLAARMKGRG